MITILGLDPGTANYGFASVSFKEKNGRTKFRINEIGLLENTLKNLKEASVTRAELLSYEKELGKLIRKHSPDALIIERFLIRSFRTPTAEQVAFMIAYTFSFTKKFDLNTVLAVTWKNAVNKTFGFKIDKYYKQVHAWPHEIDAVLMSFYLHGCLGELKTAKARKKLQCQLEKKTVRPPKRKKAAAKKKAAKKRVVKKK